MGLSPAARKLLDQLNDSMSMALPHGLQAALRSYQVRGIEWLARNARPSLGGVIAADMGLGKAPQVIAPLLHLEERAELDAGRTLVIVPTSMLTHWQKAPARFAPTLPVEISHGSKRALAEDATGAARPDLTLPLSDALQCRILTPPRSQADRLGWWRRSANGFWRRCVVWGTGP